MKPQTWILILLALTIALGMAAFAQDQSALPGFSVDPSSLGSSLILWSEMQRPEPVPQPLPAKPAPLPDPPAGVEPPPSQTPNAQPQPQQPSDARTITGTIVKDGDKYVLKTSDKMTYQLDDQEKAKQYEGKKVKITGTLEVNSNTLHIESIELVS
jgi:uncharacterized protein DUF5818